MSHFTVYNDEMPDPVLSERDIELLLGAHTPEKDDLARFAATLRALHDNGATIPTDEAVSAFAETAAQLAVDARVHAAGTSAPTRRTGGFSLGVRKRLAGGLATGILLSGMTGAAVAADGAAPGDALYGLDRAMEAIGVGDGGSSERIAEAQILFDKGEIRNAIAHAAEAFETTDTNTSDEFSHEASKAAEALRSAAERVTTDMGEVEAEGLSNSVAGVLSEIAALLESDELDSVAFGARISELARSIGGSRVEGADDRVPGDEEFPVGPDDRGPPIDVPGGPSDAPSGPPPDVPEPPAGAPARP